MGEFQRNDDYQEVADRIVKFYEAFPDGRLTSETRFEVIPMPRMAPMLGAKKEKVGDKYRWPVDLVAAQVVVVCVARAYRTPDDPTPCVGTASEPYPGLTPYTEDSEVMNAETSAWGRAIVATGCTKAKKIASANEVRGRRQDDERGQRQRTASNTASSSSRPTTTRTEATEHKQNPYAQAVHIEASKLGLADELLRQAIKDVTGDPSANSVNRENRAAVLESVRRYAELGGPF